MERRTRERERGGGVEGRMEFSLQAPSIACLMRECYRSSLSEAQADVAEWEGEVRYAGGEHISSLVNKCRPVRAQTYVHTKSMNYADTQQMLRK